MRTISVALAVVIRPLLIDRKGIRDRGGRNEVITVNVACCDHGGWRPGLGLFDSYISKPKRAISVCHIPI